MLFWGFILVGRRENFLMFIMGRGREKGKRG